MRGYKYKMEGNPNPDSSPKKEGLAKNTRSRTNSKRDYKGPKLPWWVELLFVQVGLPDKWLRYILRQKKNSKQFIGDNKKLLYYSVVLLFTLSYVYPVVRNARLRNSCMKGAIEYYSDKLGDKEYDEVIIKSLSTNLCNGGAI